MVHWPGSLFRTKEHSPSPNPSGLKPPSFNYALPQSIQSHNLEKRDDKLTETKLHDASIHQAHHKEEKPRCYSESNIEIIMNEQEERDCPATRSENASPIGPFHEPVKPLIFDPNHVSLHRQAIAAINDRNYDLLMECVKNNPDIILYPCHKQDNKTNVNIHGVHGGTLLHLLVSDKPKLKVGGRDSWDKYQECEMYIISSLSKKHFDQITKLKPEALWTVDDEGRLPLHRAVMAYAKTLNEIYATVYHKNPSLQIKVSKFVNKQLNMVELVLNLYPQAACAVDNKGNLPLHYAMTFPPDLKRPIKECTDSLLGEKAFSTLKKSSNVRKYLSSLSSMNTAEILYILVDAFPEGLVKRNKMCDTPIHLLCSKGPMINLTSLEVLLYSHCAKKMSLIERNGSDDQALHVAIKSGAPLEVVRLFAIVERISQKNWSLFEQRDARGYTPLLLALQSYSAPTSLPLISLVLEAAPSASAVLDEKGLLPIESATRLHLPDNVIRIMLEHDMPIAFGVVPQQDEIRNYGYGNIVHRLHHHSFWHVSVNCDDRYLNMIREFLIESATLLQTVALAQQVGPDGTSILINSVSSPYRRMLRSLLILYHRYEIKTSNISGYAPFTLIALDHGAKIAKADRQGPRNEIRKVLLRCYLYKDAFLAEKNIRKDFQLSSDFIEEVIDYHAENVDSPLKLSLNDHFYFISYERPFHTLEQVFTAVAPWERTGLWFTKCGIVTSQILVALHHLHERNLVHGNLDPGSIGKYGNTWKLMNVGLVARVGDQMRGFLRSCAPPESVAVNVKKESSRPPSSPNRVQFARDKLEDEVDDDDDDDDDETVEESRHQEMSCCMGSLSIRPNKMTASNLVFGPGKVEKSWDIWGLGLIMVHLFLGSCPHLPNFEKSEDAHLRNLQHFNLSTLQTIRDQIGKINENAADLVGRLLHPDPTQRPNIEEIQKHRYYSMNQCQCFY